MITATEREKIIIKFQYTRNSRPGGQDDEVGSETERGIKSQLLSGCRRKQICLGTLKSPKRHNFPGIQKDERFFARFTFKFPTLSPSSYTFDCTNYWHCGCFSFFPSQAQDGVSKFQANKRIICKFVVNQILLLSAYHDLD